MTAEATPREVGCNEGLGPNAQAVERDPHCGGSSYEASMLRNLLARIHGDGGHYVEQHGLEKALQDADTLVAAWRAAPDVAQIVAAERERCANLCAGLEASVWRTYKNGGSANQHTEGRSDGAGECAALIRGA